MSGRVEEIPLIRGESMTGAAGCRWGVVVLALGCFAMKPAVAQGAEEGKTADAPVAGSPAVGVSAVNAEDARFRAIYTAEWKWRTSSRGEGEGDDRGRVRTTLPKVDAATQQAKLVYWADVLRKLGGIDAKKLSPAEEMNFEVYREQIQVLENAQKFKEYERPVNSDSSFWSDMEGGGRDGYRTAAEYRAYIAQLKDVPRYFAEEMANMRAGLKRGFTPPQVTLKGRDLSIAATAEAKSPEDTVYYKPFVTMPASIPAEEQTKLRAEAAEAIRTSVMPAYAKLLTFWRAEYVPGAVVSLAAEDLPDGKAYYQSKILEFGTVTMTPAEIHALGLSEMAKIHTEMLAAMKDSGFQGTFPEFLEYLRTDPKFYAKTPVELLMRAAYIAKEFDGVAGKYFGYEPRRRFAIKPVPMEIAPFYTSGRGGMTVYWVNTYDLPARGLYSLPALTLHESAPGHSWQQAIVAEHTGLPKFRGVYISAYGEGWALYCERLGTEMGIYHTPYETFGMLSYQAWRAARLVVDTGVHSQGWTREQAQRYLHDNTALSDHEIETEVDRYISWPGQSLSYYLGEMEIEKERAKAEAALGAKFNIRAFHDAVLETGGVPLPVLEEHMDAWIKGGGVGPYPEMEK
jgi:uncharacterized protein (DUF885 family)